MNKIFIHSFIHSFKLQGTTGGVDAGPFLFLRHPVRVSRHCSTHVSPVPFSTLLAFSDLPLYLARMSGEAMYCKLPRVPSGKWQPVAKVAEGDQIHLVPIISKVGGDASRGFHRVVAPIIIIIIIIDIFGCLNGKNYCKDHCMGEIMTRKGNVIKVKQFRSSGGKSMSSACS